MLSSGMIVSGDTYVQKLVSRAMTKTGSRGSVLMNGVTPVIVTDIADAKNVLNERPVPALILLDSRTTSDGHQQNGSVEPVINFLDWIRANDIRVTSVDKAVPVLVLAPERMQRLDERCTVDDSALSIPLRWLDRDGATELNNELLYDVVMVLLASSGNIDPIGQGVALDLELSGTRLKYLVRFKGEPRRQMWAEETLLRAESNKLKTLLQWATVAPGLAGGATQGLPDNNWHATWEQVGGNLFQVFFRGLSNELLGHLSAAAGGMRNLYFRFSIDEDAMHHLPVEAIHYDQAGWQFISVKSPVTRRVRATRNRPPGGRSGDGAWRVLFVDAQLSRSVATFEVDHPWDADVPPVRREFKPLRNIPIEYWRMRKVFKGAGSMTMDVLKPRLCGGKRFAKCLETLLKSSRFNIVHFTGHSYTAADGRTYIILPGQTASRADALPIESFAGWVGGAGASLVYLSSCHGASPRATASLVQEGIDHCLGFRWDVDDLKAAEFAQHFYQSMMDQGPRPYCVAFRDAIGQMHSAQRRNTIWAAPILVMQTDNWADSGLAMA